MQQWRSMAACVLSYVESAITNQLLVTKPLQQLRLINKDWIHGLCHLYFLVNTSLRPPLLQKLEHHSRTSNNVLMESYVTSTEVTAGERCWCTPAVILEHIIKIFDPKKKKIL